MKGKAMRGYVQLYTGDGKGKTTAAIGLAVRAAGAGLRVFFGQFMKSGPYNEITSLQKLAPQIDVRQFGREEFVTGKASLQDITMAREGLHAAREAMTGGAYDLVILDEALVANFFHLFEAEDLLELIARKPETVELVLTGRRADPRLVDAADLVTEMRLVKHYYDQGVAARNGIED
ncbi:MAG: cob(I)yrinic acid a,c-diamide adenosyltransferase [bacterium]